MINSGGDLYNNTQIILLAVNCSAKLYFGALIYRATDISCDFVLVIVDSLGGLTTNAVVTLQMYVDDHNWPHDQSPPRDHASNLGSI